MMSRTASHRLQVILQRPRLKITTMTEQQNLWLELFKVTNDVAKADEAYDHIIEKSAKVETSPTDALEDGIYICFKDGKRSLFDEMMVYNTENVTHVGIKLGHLALGVALKDLGEHELPRNKNGNFIINTWDAIDDYDGKGNTERLKKAGLDFELGAGQWIPSLGELRFIFMHVKQLNQALTALGADPFVKDWYWSSTEYGQYTAWNVSFSNGGVNSNGNRTTTYRVRPVVAF